MILFFNDLIEKLTAEQQAHGNIEVEIVGFEGESPIDQILIQQVSGKKVLRICEMP